MLCYSITKDSEPFVFWGFICSAFPICCTILLKQCIVLSCSPLILLSPLTIWCVLLLSSASYYFCNTYNLNFSHIPTGESSNTCVLFLTYILYDMYNRLCKLCKFCTINVVENEYLLLCPIFSEPWTVRLHVTLQTR